MQGKESEEMTGSKAARYEWKVKRTGVDQLGIATTRPVGCDQVRMEG